MTIFPLFKINTRFYYYFPVILFVIDSLGAPSGAKAKYLCTFDNKQKKKFL